MTNEEMQEYIIALQLDIQILKKQVIDLQRIVLELDK